MRPKAGKCTPSVWKWVAGGTLPSHFIECAKYLASQRRSNRHLSWMWRRQQDTVAIISSGIAIKSIGSQGLPSTCRSGVPLSTYRGVHNSHQSLWQYGKKKKKQKTKTKKKKRSTDCSTPHGGECARIKYLTELVAESRGPSYNQHSGPFEAL